MAPSLSLILCSRNDRYMGNSVWRLETTLNHLGEHVARLGRERDVEVLVTDWGSDVPLRQAAALGSAAARIVSFVTVPPMLARALQRDSPFPEVLALNAAARRARGRYIGRIDQDTLVGERFLRWFFETVERERPLPSGAIPDDALLFANRRDIPYRIARSEPSLTNIERFIASFGATRPVLRENRATGDLFWTSSVGIWLAHRTLWHECGGYDERLIYYNWMETDMICRLRQTHPIVDLGELTDHDFHHLEHYHPRVAWFDRGHERKNPDIDLAVPAARVHPNAESWGLRDHELPVEPSERQRVDEPAPRRRGETLAFALLIVRWVAGAAADRVAIAWTVQRRTWERRRRSAGRELAGQRVWRRPGALWTLWTDRPAARIRTMAGLRTSRLRTALARLCDRAGVLASARRMRLRIALATNREIRSRDREVGARFAEFAREYGAAIRPRLNGAGRDRKTALVVSSRCPTIEGELCTIKALQLAGFRIVVLLEDEQRALAPYYELAGVDKVHTWIEFLASHDYSRQAADIVGRCASAADLQRCVHDGVRVGTMALCTALRRVRVGALDVRTPGVRPLLVRSVAASLSAAASAQRILNAVAPDLVLTDTEYTPKGELFDTCLENGLDVISYDTAHRSHTLMFKRYGHGNRGDHLTTISARSWSLLRGLAWTPARRRELAREVTASYMSGDWHGTPWTPSHAELMDPAALRRALGLDPARKAAFIFPHMLWDAPLLWGTPLFSSYQEWFVETVAAARRNTEVQWVIKIHPAHARKQADERYCGRPAELRVLDDRFGTLPPHITVIPPDAPMSTLSLFGVMDYCLTVRGTVGVEAARLGIPVLTAGAARYSGLGFTIDSETRAEYLARLARIQATPPLSDDQRELAERFAYGLFVLRPLPLTSVSWDPAPPVDDGRPRDRRARIHPRSDDEWRRAADVRALADWFASRDEDFLARVEDPGREVVAS